MALAALLATLIFGSLGVSRAQPGTAAQPVNSFSDLGLPEIAVKITNEAFEGAPARLPAGRYVLSVANAFDESIEETAGAALLLLPAEVSVDDFIAAGGDDDSPWPADWYYATRLAGGAYAALGETAYAVIDLTAGDWILWSEAPGAAQVPVPIAVTGAPPAELPAPMADVSVELSDFGFSFSAPLRSGPQVIEVVNTGDQPHFVFVGGVPAGTTVAEAQTAFEAFWNPESTPPATFSFAEAPELVGTGDQSAGTTAWYAIDLPAGTIVVACFVTDPETGQPHAMLGMTEMLEVT